VAQYVLSLLHEYGVIDNTDKIKAVGIRIVAPTTRFTQDELITDEIEAALESVSQKAPLHVKTALSEIKQLKSFFPDAPVIAISDSSFHSTKPAHATYYGIDTKFADEFDIKRFGYHGVSVESVTRKLIRNNNLAPKTIICHLGSGNSVTAVRDGKSVETTMGYTPLEGLMMASRSGNIDVSAALAIKRELELSDDDLERYLNKQSGLLGVSGTSDDIRQLIANEANGDERSKLALDIFVYRIQLAIGQMAAAMGGADCLVFSATIGERSSIIRSRILNNLGYLGFVYDSNLNDQAIEPKEVTNVGIDSSKPILVVLTDEASGIARRAEEYANNIL
jgi:acetate kinase